MYGMPAIGKDLFPGEPALPMFRKPEYLTILVVGGSGRHSCWMPTFGTATKSVTRAIALEDGTPVTTIEQFRRR